MIIIITVIQINDEDKGLFMHNDRIGLNETLRSISTIVSLECSDRLSPTTKLNTAKNIWELYSTKIGHTTGFSFLISHCGIKYITWDLTGTVFRQIRQICGFTVSISRPSCGFDSNCA